MQLEEVVDILKHWEYETKIKGNEVVVILPDVKNDNVCFISVDSENNTFQFELHILKEFEPMRKAQVLRAINNNEGTLFPSNIILYYKESIDYIEAKSINYQGVNPVRIQLQLTMFENRIKQHLGKAKTFLEIEEAISVEVTKKMMKAIFEIP